MMSEESKRVESVKRQFDVGPNTNSGLVIPDEPLSEKQTIKRKFKRPILDTNNNSGKQVNSTLSPIKKKIVIKKKKISHQVNL